MKYGIEFEYFIVNKESVVVPAYEITENLDGNPVIGELRTSIHNNIIDCIFELKKLIYNEECFIKDKGFMMVNSHHTVNVDDDFLRKLRKSKEFINNKNTEILEELSIYPGGKTGKLLPRKTYKASLQINFSDNKEFSYTEYNKVTVEDKYKYDTKVNYKSYSSLFDYVTIISKLDIAFAEELKNSDRVKGVYAIKSGELGDRIEYRSLPNTVSLDKIIEILK